MIQSPTSNIVLQFAEDMEDKLSQNRDKGDQAGWLQLSYVRLMDLMYREFEELQVAIWDEPPEQVIKEAADIANFAMMIADKARQELKQ